MTGSSTATTHKLPPLNRNLLIPGIVTPDTLRATVPISEKTSLFEYQRTALESTAGYVSHSRTFNKTQVIHEELTVINAECFDGLYQCIISSFEAIGMVNRAAPPGIEFLQIPISGADTNIILIESPETSGLEPDFRHDHQQFGDQQCWIHMQSRSNQSFFKSRKCYRI